MKYVLELDFAVSGLVSFRGEAGSGRTVGLSVIVTDCVAVTVMVSIMVHTTILIAGDPVGDGTCIHAIA